MPYRGVPAGNTACLTRECLQVSAGVNGLMRDLLPLVPLSFLHLLPLSNTSLYLPSSLTLSHFLSPYPLHLPCHTLSHPPPGLFPVCPGSHRGCSHHLPPHAAGDHHINPSASRASSLTDRTALNQQPSCDPHQSL